MNNKLIAAKVRYAKILLACNVPDEVPQLLQEAIDMLEPTMVYAEGGVCVESYTEPCEAKVGDTFAYIPYDDCIAYRIKTHIRRIESFAVARTCLSTMHKLKITVDTPIVCGAARAAITFDSYPGRTFYRGDDTCTFIES